MSGRRSKAERREAKLIIEKKLEEARRLKILPIVGPPPTVHQLSRTLRRQRASRI